MGGLNLPFRLPPWAGLAVAALGWAAQGTAGGPGAW
jgi:hypothetical protein